MRCSCNGLLHVLRAVLVNTTLILDGTSVAGQVHLSGLSVRVNAPALRHSSSFLVIVFVLAGKGSCG